MNKNPLLEQLNSTNYFGETLGEVEFNKLFGTDAGKENLRMQLNKDNYFGEEVQADEFNSLFFSSPSLQSSEEESDKYGQDRTWLSDPKTKGFTPDLPDVQTESVVPEIDPATDATSIDPTSLETNEDMDMTKGVDYLSRQAKLYAEQNAGKIASGEISEAEVRQHLSSLVEGEYFPEGVPTWHQGAEETMRSWTNSLFNVVQSTINPEEKGLSEKRMEMAELQSEVNQVPVIHAQKQLENAHNRLNASQDLGEKMSIKEEIKALEQNLQDSKGEYRAEYGIDKFIEGYQEEGLENYDKDQIALPVGSDREPLRWGQIRGRETEVMKQLISDIDTGVEKFLSDDNEVRDFGAEELGNIFKKNELTREEDIKKVQTVMYNARNGMLDKKQTKEVLKQIYYQSLEDQMIPDNKMYKIVSGVGTAPVDIMTDIVGLTQELPASVAMMFTQEDEEVIAKKQEVADSFEKFATGEMTVNEVNDKMVEFRDFESDKVNKMLGWDDTFMEFDTQGKINTDSAKRQYRKDVRRLTENTWNGLTEKYEKGEISKMEEYWLKGGVAMSNAFQSLPSFGQAMIPYIGIASMSAKAGTDKFFEGVEDMDADYKEVFLGGAAVAMAEAFSGKIEKYIGTDALRSMSKLGRTKAINHVVSDYSTYLEALQKGLMRNAKMKGLQKGAGRLLFDANAEGIGEMFVTMTTNLVDRDILGKDVKVFDGIAETYWTGFAMGAGAGSIGGIAEGFTTAKMPLLMQKELSNAYSIAKKFKKKAGKQAGTAEGGSLLDLGLRIEAVAQAAGVSLEVARDAVKMTFAEGSSQLDVVDASMAVAEAAKMQRAIQEGGMDAAAESMADTNAEPDAVPNMNEAGEMQVGRAPKKLDDMRVTRPDGVVVPEGAPDPNQVDDKKYHLSEVSTTQDIGKFVKSFNEAREKRPETKLQVDPVTEAQLQKIIDEGGRIYMTSDGMAGGYVTKDGYMGGLFRDPEAMKGRASKVIMDEMVKVGGRFFDAFGVNPETMKGTTLEDIYLKNGFRPLARMTFNPEMAPEGWQDSATLKHKPDNVWFVYDPTYQAEKGEGEYIEDYDEAYNAAQSFVQSAPTPNPEANVPAGMEGQTPVQGETLQNFSERANEAAQETRKTQEEILQEKRDRIEDEGIPEGWNGTAADLEAEYLEIIGDSERAINQNSTPEEVAEFVKELFNRLHKGKADSKGAKDAIKVVTTAIMQAQEFARANGSLFVMPLNPEDATIVNAWNLGTKIGETTAAYGYYVADSGDIHIDPFALANSGEFVNLTASKQFANIANTVRHELFHGIIDVALRASNLRGLTEGKVKLELARQIGKMFTDGKLKFAGGEAEAKFGEFLRRYENDPTEAVIEEMIVELVPRILTGEILYDSAVKTNGWNKLMNLIIDVVNNILGTSINFNNIDSESLRASMEAESMITMLLASTKPSNLMSIKQVNAVMGQIFLRAEQRAFAFNDRFAEDQEAADYNKRAEFYDQFLSVDYDGIMNQDAFTEDELTTMTTVGNNPIGQIMFQKPSVKGKDYIAFRNDIANARLITMMKKEAQDRGYQVYEEAAGVVVVGMTEDVALNFMRDNNEIMNAVVHNGSILMSDGKRIPTPKQLGHRHTDIHLGRSFLTEDGELMREHPLDPTITLSGLSPKKAEVLYDAESATSIIESSKPAKEGEQNRIAQLGRDFKKAGMLQQAQALEMLQKSMHKLPNKTKVKLNLTKTNVRNRSANTFIVNLATDNANTMAYKLIQHYLANKDGAFREAYVKYFSPTKLMSKGRFPTDKNTALNLLTGVLAGRYNPTDAELMDIAKNIIATKNKFIKEELGIKAAIPDNLVTNKKEAIEVMEASVNELMYMDSDILQDVLQEEGSISGTLHTDRYVLYKDMETEKPRAMTQEKLDSWARQYEKQLGLPEGSVNVPMFDPRSLPKGTRIMQVPHDRQYSGVVRSPFGGDFEVSGGVLGMFHPQRVKDGTVYMSELSAVSSFINAAERTAKFIAKEQGLSEVPNKVIVAPAMGKDNWLNNEDTSKFVAFMAEEYYGDEYTAPMPKRFKSYIEGLFTIWKTDYVKTEKLDKNGNIVMNKKGDKPVMVNKLGEDGKPIIEAQYFHKTAPMKKFQPLLDNSETIKDFFDAVSTLSFDDRASMSAKYLSVEATEQKVLNRKKTEKEKKAVYDINVGKHRDAVFVSQMKDALLNVMVEPTWNNMPTNHLIAMFEVDIAATKASVARNLELQRSGQPLEQSVPHNTYDTDVKGEWLGVLTESMYAPKVLDFTYDLLEETMLRAKDHDDKKHKGKIDNVWNAYNKSKKSLDEGTATPSTASNVSRMGVVQTLAGSLDMDQTIGTTDIHSSDRIAPTDTRFDPDSGVRMSRAPIQAPSNVRPNTYGANVAATVQARQNRKAARRQEMAKQAKLHIRESLDNAINDIKAKNIKGINAMSKSSIKEVRKLLEGESGKRIAAFVAAATQKLQKMNSPLFKGDEIIVETLKKEFGIDTDQAILMLEALTGRQYSSTESAQEKERRETYKQIVMNTMTMYATVAELKPTAIERIADFFKIPKYEVIDTYMGDNKALLHRRIKDLIEIKEKQLEREIPKLERMEQDAIARGDMAAAQIIADNLADKVNQRDNMMQYKDELDAYNALDRVNSMAAATKAEMREWFYMGDNSFIERVKEDFDVGEFNDLLKAMHADERMDRQIEIIKEALGLAKVSKITTEEEIEAIKERMGTKKERMTDEARLDALKRKRKKLKEEIAELKEKRKKAIYHASDVISPQAKALKDKLKAMPKEKQDKFEALRQEMIENLLHKRLDMLKTAGVISNKQYEQLMAGGRKSIDQVNREKMTAILEEKLLSGKMTQAEYEAAVDKLDNNSFYRKKHQKLTKLRREIEIRLDEALAEETELDNKLIDKKISQYEYDKKIKEIQQRIDEHEKHITDIEQTKKELVYEYSNFENYVPFSINEDAYMENFLAKMYEENFPEADRMEYIEASKGISALMQQFGNDVMADESAPEFNTLSEAVRDSMEDGHTDPRKLKERARRFEKIKKLVKKGKGSRAGIDSTIQSIKGNYEFSLNDMNPPMAVLMTQFEKAAKVSVRNEAKLKLVKLIEEVNEIMATATNQSDLVHFDPIGRVIPSEGANRMKLSQEVKMIWEDQQPDTKYGALTSEERETAMSVMIDGKQNTIVFGVDPDTKLMARALIQDEATDFDTIQSGRIGKAWKGFANVYRAMITTASIYFNVNNVQRDALEAIANVHYVQDTYRRDGVESTAEMAKRMAKDTAKMMTLIAKMAAAHNKGQANKMTLEVPDPNGGTYRMTFAELIAEAKQHGGLMSWSMLNDQIEADGLEAVQKYINKKADEAGRYKDKSKAYKFFAESGRVLFSLPKVWKMGDPDAHRGMYYMNKLADSLENHNRLAAYMMARQKGLSADQAAAVSRNATVNFEKAGALLKSARLPNQTATESSIKGLLQFVQGMYLFIRPAVQGARKNFQRIGTKEGRMGMGAMVMMSMAKNALIRAVHHDDDEEEMKNLYRDIYMNEGYYQIPVAKGININVAKPYSVDRVIDNTINRMYGSKYTGKTSSQLFWEGLKDFVRISTPIDITQKNRGLAMFAPTAAQPFADLWTNTTYSGRQPLRNTDDLRESISLDMLKGTNVLGYQLSEQNSWVWMSSKLFDMGLENRLTSPQGLKHLWDGYVANAGYFKVMNQAARSLGSTTKEKLQRDEDLSKDRIRMIQTGKVLRYVSVDEGTNKLASTIYTRVKEPVSSNMRAAASNIMAIEEGYLANRELGNLETTGQETNMKRVINKWFVENARKGNLTMAMMEEYAPETLLFLNESKLIEKQMQSVIRGKAGFSEKDQKRLERAGSDYEIDLERFEGEAQETIDRAEQESIKKIAKLKKDNKRWWRWQNWFK